MRFLEFYLKKPVMWDSIIAGITLVIVIALSQKCILNIPSKDTCTELISDVSNLSFTSTGFVLTILTVLITFKARSKKKTEIKEFDSALDLFFQTPLYKKTTDILKQCIKILIFVALSSFLIKAFFSINNAEYLFFYGIFGIILLSLTLIRCVLILGKVLKLQTDT